MTETKNDVFSKIFSLGPGMLYIAGGGVPESEMESSGVCAGITDGGCTLSYEYKIKELYDTAGEPAAEIRYGEKLRVSGKLCRISGAALPLLSGKESDRLSLLLICPLPDGDDFRLYVRGGVASGIVFHAERGGTLEFEMMCGRGFSLPEFRLAGTEGRPCDAGIA